MRQVTFINAREATCTKVSEDLKEFVVLLKVEWATKFFTSQFTGLNSTNLGCKKGRKTFKCPSIKTMHYIRL